MARKSTSKRKKMMTTTSIPEVPAVTIDVEAPVVEASVDTSENTSTHVAEVLPPPEEPKTFGKRELIDRVVATSGIKKKAAKPVVEAMLRELGEALSRGDTLNLQPLGKGIVKTRKSLENAEVVELRLRRSRLAIANADASIVQGLSERAEEESEDDADSIAEAAE